MRKINIFLALGEKDVRDDKNEISSYINHLNDKYEDKDIYIRLITDDDIDKKLKDITEEDINKSEMFFIIFGNDIKDEALKEFNLAYDKFKKDSNPKIVTFSKKINKRKEKVTDFLEKLGNKLGHYYNEYEHIDSIKLELVEQLESIGLKEFKLVTKDGKVYLNDEKIVDLDNIPMFFNNEQLTKLKEEYKELEDKYWSLKRKINLENEQIDESELQEVSEKYINTKNNIDYLEKKIFSLSQTFVNVSGKGILTKKQVYARECLEKGNLEEAENILDLKSIEEDIKNVEEFQKEVRSKIKGHIQELILRADTYKLDIANPNRFEEIIASYEKAIKAEKENNLPRETLKIYAEYCEEQECYEKAAELIDMYIKYLEAEQLSVDPDLYLELENNYTMSNQFDYALKQYEIIKEILSKNFDDLLYVKSELYHADMLAKQLENNQISLKIANESSRCYSNLIKYFLKKELYYIDDNFAYLYIKANYHIGKYIKENVSYLKKAFHYYMDAAVRWIEEKKFKDRSKFKDINEMTMMIFTNYAEFQEKHGEYADALKYYEKSFDILEKIFQEKPEVYSDFLGNLSDKLDKLYDKYDLFDRKIQYDDKYADIIENQITIFNKNDEIKKIYHEALLYNMINKYSTLKNKEGFKYTIDGAKKKIEYQKELLEKLKKSNFDFAKKEYEKQKGNLKQYNEYLEKLKELENTSIKLIQEKIDEGDKNILEEKYQDTINSNFLITNDMFKSKDVFTNWTNLRTMEMFNEIFKQIVFCCIKLNDNEQLLKCREQQVKFLDSIENNGKTEEVKTLIQKFKIEPEYSLASLYFNKKYFKKALIEYEKLERIQDIFKKIKFDGYSEGDLEKTRELKILTLISLKKYKEAEELKYNTLRDLDSLISIYADGKGADSKFRKIKLSILKNTKELHNKKSKYDEIGEIEVNVQDESGKNLKNTSVLVTGKDYSHEVNFNGYGVIYHKIKPGNYKAKLTKIPDGYEAKENEFDVTVDVGEVPKITFNLEKIMGTISVKVIDDDNNPMKNCFINIYDSDGCYITEVETDEYGLAKITISTGKFYIKQVKNIPCYHIDDTLYKFVVSKENRTFDVTLINKKYKGRVAMQVKDIKGNPIKDLKCGIYDENKKLIIEIVTNEKGQMGARNLRIGTYYYKLEGKKKYVEFQIKEKDEIVIFNIIGETNE